MSFLFTLKITKTLSLSPSPRTSLLLLPFSHPSTSKMERKSLSKSLKDHCVGSSRSATGDSPSKLSHHQNILMGPRNLNNQRSTTGEDHRDLCVGGGLVSWPPRSYSCGFCKREFRSAQALGGHMNVHRRDRARLRQSFSAATTDDHHPILSLNPNPSQNPKPSRSPNPSKSNSGPPRFSSSNFSSPLPSTVTHSSSSPSPVNNIELAGSKLCRGSSLRVRDCSNSMQGFPAQSTLTLSHRTQGEGSRCLKNGPLNLEIGSFTELRADDVDLELRLGFS